MSDKTTIFGNTEASLALARTAQKLRRQEAKDLNLRKNFEDNEYWKELARLKGIRLPNWMYPPTPKSIRRYLRRLDISISEYKDVMGFKSLNDFRDRNPDWPLRALVGVLLEYQFERDQARLTLTRGR